CEVDPRAGASFPPRAAELVRELLSRLRARRGATPFVAVTLNRFGAAVFHLRDASAPRASPLVAHVARVPAFAADPSAVVGVVGAGDTYLAVLAEALAAGATLADANALAVVGGSAAVVCGCVTVSRLRLRAYLEEAYRDVLPRDVLPRDVLPRDVLPRDA